MSKNLIINMSFNPPTLDILGPIKESTIDRLNEVVPHSTTSTRSIRNEPPKFEYLANPDHWHLKLDGQFCDADGISRMMVILLDAVEEEGDWTLVSSQASSAVNNAAIQQTFVENYKMTFLKFAGDE